MTTSLRDRAEKQFKQVQSAICQSLENLDGQANFNQQSWERPDLVATYGGGGITRVLRNGGVFEQAGVNFSSVSGTLPSDMSEKLIGSKVACSFFATGISLVLHPHSPRVPTTHANFRYLEVADRAWFGGGMDLTPYYLYEEDAQHFHRTIQSVCNQYDPSYYTKFKKWCDEYFYLPHRKETRGIGGIFFDYLGKDDSSQLEVVFPFVCAMSNAFIDCYVPIAARRKQEVYSQKERDFQLVRRGRYVEFNLLYDRGTLFGLKTGGRTESILMSLPPLVRWEYEYQVEPGSAEEKLIQILQNPRNWLGR